MIDLVLHESIFSVHLNANTIYRYQREIEFGGYHLVF